MFMSVNVNEFVGIEKQQTQIRQSTGVNAYIFGFLVGHIIFKYRQNFLVLEGLAGEFLHQ